jgi:hypothetical protein
VLHHLPALLALTCPSVNSYRRLQRCPGSAYTSGADREAALRVPSPYRSDVAGSTNAELKASGAPPIRISLGGLLQPPGWTACGAACRPASRC